MAPQPTRMDPKRACVLGPTLLRPADLALVRPPLRLALREDTLVAPGPRSLHLVLPELPRLRRVRELDISALHSYEAPGVQTAPREFWAQAPLHLAALERLRLGPACIHQQNGADAGGVWDIHHAMAALPRFPRLRTLEVGELLCRSDVMC